MPHIVRSPQHRLYLKLTDTTLTVIHVRDNDSGGVYFTTTIDGPTPEDRLLSALLTALSSVPYHSTAYIHTSVAPLMTLIREERTWPRELKALLKRLNLTLRLGLFSKMDRFWQDMLTLIEAGNLPEPEGFNNHALYTYAITDGHQTHMAGVLYGEGQLHLYSHQHDGDTLSPPELDAARWAFELVARGKTVELHHFHPATATFWDNTSAYLATYPQVKPLAERIGTLVEQKSLRYNVALPEHNSPLRQAVKWVAGRALA